MRETLYIRLTSPRPEAQTAYCIAGAQAQNVWPVMESALGDVLALAANRRLVVFLPAADVRLTQVNVPARSAAKILQAAPYALEDQFAEDVDDLHFALGPRQADGSHAIAVTARSRMQEWLAPFQAAGLRPEVFVPETLCLPAAEPGRCSALAEPGHVTVRTGACAGFGCAEDDLPLFLQLADPDKKNVLRIAIPRTHSPDFTRLEWPAELLPGYAHPMEALLHHYDPAQGINLLQGAYSQSEGLRRAWAPWKPAAALAAGWLLVTGLSHAVQAYSLGKELAGQNERNEQRFRSLFPAETRIVNLEAQAEQQAALLKGGRGSGGFLKLSETLARAMASSPGLSLDALQFREGALYASFSGNDLQQTESFKNWFAQNGGAVLDVQSESSGQDGVQFRVKLSPA